MPYATIFTEDKLEYKFFRAANEAIKFKVKAKNDAHIAITNAPRSEEPMCQIIIGGWRNSKIAIRYRQEPDVELPYPNALNAHEFKEFWITWYNNTINVGIANKPDPIISWKSLNFQGLFFGIRTGWGATGEWQINGYWSGWRAPASDFPPAGRGWNIRSDLLLPERGWASWVPADNGNVPPGAVLGGFDNEQLYIGRAWHDNGAILPGKVVPSRGSCFVPWGETELEFKEYEVLTGCQPGWVFAWKNEIPASAFKAGKTESGETLYVGRTFHNGTMILGKVQKSRGVCYFSYGGKELANDTYEILVL